MIYELLLKFRFYRDTSIVLFVRQNNLAVQSALQIKRHTALNGFKTTSILNDYIQMRDELFPEAEWLFVTDDGQQYFSRKFHQNIQKYLGQVKMPITPYHPKKLTHEQLEAILGLKFEYQRPTLQQSLACALLGYLALRPEGTANLIKSDVNLEKKILYLRETKSQEPQKLPIQKTLVPLLDAYLKHLQSDEPLFIRHSGKQWDRRDVNYALAKFSTFHKISEPVTPRIMRRTVAYYMRRRKVPVEIMQLLLRHKRADTTSTRYTFETNFEILSNAVNQNDPLE
jgi:site-specific recombinase XerD